MQNPDNICDEVPLQNVQIFEGSLGLKCHHGSSLWHMVQGGSNMTGTDLCVNKPHCAAAVRP